MGPRVGVGWEEGSLVREGSRVGDRLGEEDAVNGATSQRKRSKLEDDYCH